MNKITTSLTQEQEDEAIAVWNLQTDQFPLSSEQLAEKRPEHRQWKEGLFYFVFGYAHAKGWTGIEQRMERLKRTV